MPNDEYGAPHYPAKRTPGSDGQPHGQCGHNVNGRLWDGQPHGQCGYNVNGRLWDGQPHGRCGLNVNGRLAARTGNRILIQTTFEIAMKKFTVLEGDERDALQATAVFLSSRVLQNLMAQGHTRYCGLVRGPHVENQQ